MNDAVLQERLRQLRLDFLRRLPEKYAAMDAAVDALDASASEENIRTAYRMFHSLVGSAGTFGCDEVARLARTGEYVLKPALEAPHAVQPGAGSRLRELIAELRKVVVPTEV